MQTELENKVDTLLEELHSLEKEYRSHESAVDSFLEDIDEVHPGDDLRIKEFIIKLPVHQLESSRLLREIGAKKLELISATK